MQEQRYWHDALSEKHGGGSGGATEKFWKWGKLCAAAHHSFDQNMRKLYEIMIINPSINLSKSQFTNVFGKFVI